MPHRDIELELKDFTENSITFRYKTSESPAVTVATVEEYEPPKPWLDFFREQIQKNNKTLNPLLEYGGEVKIELKRNELIVRGIDLKTFWESAMAKALMTIEKQTNDTLRMEAVQEEKREKEKQKTLEGFRRSWNELRSAIG